MIYFNSDYLEGAHPAIMERLMQTNMEQTVGYGEDEYCAAAREKIKAACQAPDADVHFLVGGTLTNTTVIASILRPYQGVLTAVSGHINCHESGAIESSGHKVLALPTDNGKITARQVQDYYNWHHFNPDYEHMVMPGMVYISFPTEGGTLYSKVLLPDSVYDSVYYAPEITVESVVCDGKDGALYDLSALEQKDKYELFLGGNYGQCVITTGTENGKHLLLVKDSFANSFVPFLTGDYETITMIDLRYYRGSMAELAAEVDDILVLTEVTNLAGSGDYFKLSK